MMRCLSAFENDERIPRTRKRGGAGLADAGDVRSVSGETCAVELVALAGNLQREFSDMFCPGSARYPAHFAKSRSSCSAAPPRLHIRCSMWLAEASISDIDDRLAVAISFVKAVDAPYLTEGPTCPGWIMTQPHHSRRRLCPKSPLLPVRACWQKTTVLVRVQVQVQAVSLQVWRVKEILYSRLFATGNSGVFDCLIQPKIAHGTADH